MIYKVSWRPIYSETLYVNENDLELSPPNVELTSENHHTQFVF